MSQSHYFATMSLGQGVGLDISLGFWMLEFGATEARVTVLESNDATSMGKICTLAVKKILMVPGRIEIEFQVTGIFAHSTVAFVRALLGRRSHEKMQH